MGKVRDYSPHRKWTYEEEQRLIELSEKKPQKEIAKELNRSVQSVKSKRQRMGLEPFIVQTEKLTASDVARLIGVDRSSITRTWKKHGLRFFKKGPFRVVSEEALVNFMKSHTELWRASKCDYYFFYHYDWFMEKLNREKSGEDCGNQYTTRKEWSTYDVSRFKMLKSRGFSHQEIALQLCRTKRSIDKMSMKMNQGII